VQFQVVGTNIPGPKLGRRQIHRDDPTFWNCLCHFFSPDPTSAPDIENIGARKGNRGTNTCLPELSDCPVDEIQTNHLSSAAG